MSKDTDNVATQAEAASPADGDVEASRQYFEVQINAPIHEVWARLTRTDEVLPFFFNAVCRTSGLEQGAQIRMVSRDGRYTSVVGEVLEFEPPFRYAHTFRFTAEDDPPCVVRYRLEERDGGTRFTLINENVPAGTKTEKYMTQGGTFITQNLKSLAETGKPTFGGRLALMMMGLMAPFTPARSKSENWPL